MTMCVNDRYKKLHKAARIRSKCVITLRHNQHHYIHLVHYISVAGGNLLGDSSFENDKNKH